jgi:hypothetical protein
MLARLLLIADFLADQVVLCVLCSQAYSAGLLDVKYPLHVNRFERETTGRNLVQHV